MYKVIRGNVDTRIKKLTEGLYDAIILSKAGIDSLNLKKYISQEFTLDDIIPSVGQGIIAVQCRKNDIEMIDILKKVNHRETHICAISEREVLKTLEGDCETAIGAISFIKEQKLFIKAELFSIDGKKRYYSETSGEIESAKDLGKYLGNILKKQSMGNYKKS